MKVLHKAKQLLQGFAAPEFEPRFFLGANLASWQLNNRIPRALLAGIALILVGSILATGQNASANNITATGSNAAICNQTVGNTANVVASRVNNACIVEFRNVANTTWTPPAGVTSVQVLVVGGGGAGGAGSWTGGGGAGSVLLGTSYGVTPGSALTVKVGAGGVGGSSGGVTANSGQTSIFGAWTASGGGGGAGYGWNNANYWAQGGDGGSGGGATEENGTPSGGAFVQPDFAGAQKFGNRGGAQTVSNGSQAGAGGGGAGSAGGNAGNRVAGAGGSGMTFDMLGKNFPVAGGGGGATSHSPGGGAGGDGLGGAGGTNGGGFNGLANTGSGGGGAQTGTSGSGGSGLVVVAYSIPQLSTPSAPTVTATTNTIKSLSVAWNQVTSASSYTLRLYSSANSLLHTISGLSGTSRTITASDYSSFADNTQYRVTVQAIGSSTILDSAESSSTAATTLIRSFTQTTAQKTAGVIASASATAAVQQPQVQLAEPGGANFSPGGSTVQVTAQVGGSGCGTNSQTVNASSAGLATFSTLTFSQATLNATCTVTYSASGFASITESVNTKRIPSAITVSTSTIDSTGEWVSGTWYTGSASTSNVTPSSIETRLASGSATLNSTGAITVSNAVSGAGSGTHLTLTTSGGDVTFNATVSNAGPLSAIGTNITVNQNLTTTGSGSSPLTLKGVGNIVVADSKTIQTNGSNLVLWGSSAGGAGYIAIRNSVCINTNASCDVNVATSTGSIYMGGGVAGTTFPTGPVLDTSWRGIRLGETGSGVKVLSGGGDISLDGQSPYYGIEVFQGVVIKATTGSVSLTGRGTSSGQQALRIAGASGDSLITSGKTSGTAVLLRGIYSTHSGQYGVVLGDDDATVSATGGGDVVIEALDATAGLNTVTYLSRATVSAAAGGRVQIKAAGHIDLLTSNVLTSGPSSGSGGGISIWADSDDSNHGGIYITQPGCISTVSNCNSTPATGGSKIVIGGGAADSSDSFFPAGGGVSNATKTFGVQFGSGHTTDGVKIYSGGGDLRIASEQNGALGNYHYGQVWLGGTKVHSGNGMVELVNTASGSSSGFANYGISIEAVNSGEVSITSQKSSGDAIRVTSASNSTGDYSHAMLAYANDASRRITFAATGGGNITMNGTTTSTQTNAYTFDLNNVDILASSGAINLTGNRGFWMNRIVTGSNNFGALSLGSSSSNIALVGNRYVQNSTHANNFKTTGTLTIRPETGSSYLDATEFPKNGNTFDGVSALTFGNDTNTQSHTVGINLTDVSGAVSYKTGTFTGTGAISTTNGPVSITSSDAVTLNRAITSGSGGVSVQAAAAIAVNAATTSAGPVSYVSSGASSVSVDGNIVVSGAGNDILLKTAADVHVRDNRTLQTAGKSGGSGGRIILWSDSDASGQGFIRVENDVVLNSIGGSESTFTGGGDIQLAGGSDNGSTATTSRAASSDGLPDGWAISTSNLNFGVEIGAGATSSSTSKIFSGGGTITILGKNTTASDATAFNWTTRMDSGTGQIEVQGDSAGWGLQINRNSTSSIKSVLTSRSNTHPAIYMKGKSSGNSSYMGFLGSYQDSGRDNLLIQAVGTGGVHIVADAPSASPAMGLASTSVLSASGAITLDGGTAASTSLAGIHLGVIRSGDTQSEIQFGSCAAGSSSGQCTNSLVTSSSADVNIIANRITTGGTGNLGTTISSTGTASFLPAVGSSAFAAFQDNTAGVSLSPNLGGLVIGRSGDTTATLKLQRDWTIAGPISVYAGSLEVPNTITSSSGSISLVSNTITLAGSLRAPTGIVTLTPSTAARDIDIVETNRVSGALSLTATELERISATTLRLTNSGAGDVTLETGLDLALTGKVTNLAIRAGGNVIGQNVTIAVANLGVDAGGSISLPGTGGNAAVIALNAGSSGSISFGQSGNYAVAAVDGITPEFGYGVSFSFTTEDRTNTVNRFMAVTFNPPPVIQIRDKFGNLLASNNTSAADYVVGASMSVTRTDSGTLTAEGLTASRSVATHTFTSLRVNGGTGEISLSYTATRSDGVKLTDTSSGQNFVAINYLIVAGEPTTLSLSFVSETPRAGEKDLQPTVTLLDTGGNRITSGTHKNAQVSITMTGTTGRIVSGDSASTVDGQVSFPDLIIAGKVSQNNKYTLTFSVTYTNSSNQSVTVNARREVTLIAGVANRLAVSSTSQTVTSRATLADVVVSIEDAYENVVGSAQSVLVTPSIGATHSQSVTLTGTRSRLTDVNSGSVTYSGLALTGKADDYTLTFSADGLTSTTHTVRVGHGAAHSLVVSGATTASNDRSFDSSVVVEIFDQDLNLVSTGSQSTQTVSLSVAEATLSGTVQVSATAGRATFNSLKLVGEVGTKVLTASISSPQAITKSHNILLGFGQATKVTLTTSASGFVNDVDFATQPAITVQDSSGNTVTNYATNVSVSSTAVDVSQAATLSGTNSIAPGSGVATFTNLRLKGKVGQFDLTFSSAGLSTTTQRITLTHGAVAAVVLSGATTASNARTFDSSVRVEIQDADQNIVTTGTAAAQSIVMTATGATISGTTTRSASAGVAIFNDLALTGSVGSKTLTATILDPTSRIGTRAIELSHGLATQLVLTTQATSATNRAAFGTQPIVSVRDVSGNPVSSFVGRVSVGVSSAGSNSAVISGTTFRDLSSSPTATFTGLGLNGAVGNYTLTYSSTDLTSATQSITLTPGTATNLQLVAPANAANSIALDSDVVVRVRDFDNNVITGNTSSIALTISNATISGTATRSAVAGEAIFPGLSIVGETGPKTLTATMTSPSSLTQTSSVQLTFGTATKLSISTAATGAVNRQAFTTQPSVVVQDVSGNPVTTFNGDVTVAVSPAGTTLSGTTTRTLTNTSFVGFTGLGLNGTAGDYTLTFTSNGLTSTSHTIRLAHGEAHSLVVSGATTASNNRNLDSAVIVDIFDIDNNLVTTGDQSTQTVTVSVAGATLSGTTQVSATAGRATFNSLKLVGEVGTKVLTASISSPQAITDDHNILLGFGAATRVYLSSSASGFVNDVDFATQPAITVQDSSGNTVTNYATNVSVTATAVDVSKAATLSGTNSIAPGSGVATFTNLRLKGKVGQFDLTFSSAGLSTTTQRVTLTHGAATAVVLSGATTAVNAGAFDSAITASIQDADQNVVTSGAGSTQNIVLSATGSTLSGTLTLPASAGQAVFSDLKLTGSTGAKTLRATISSPSTFGEREITVSHGVAHSISLQVQRNAVNNQVISDVVVRIFDESLNLVTSGAQASASISLASSSPELTGTLVRSASAGIATLDALRFLGSTGTKNVTAQAASLSLTSTTTTVDVTHGVATKMVLTTTATGAVNRAGFATVPVVTLQDISDNPVLDSSATVVVSESSSGVALSGTVSRTPSSGVVTFTGLGLNGTAGQYTLTYASANLPSITQSVDLTHGVATKLSVLTPAGSSRSGINFATQSVIRILDQDNNLVSTGPSATETVTVALDNLSAPYPVTLSGDVDIAAVGGQASFVDLRLTGTVGTYDLEYTAASLTPASHTIQVLAGEVASINVVTAPANSVAGVNFANTVSVELLDAAGNRVLSDSSTDVIANLVASADVSSRGVTATTARASSGLVSFTGLDYELAGDHKINFTVGNISQTSTSFTITHAIASKFVINTQPGSMRNDMVVGVAPALAIFDAFDNPVLSGSAVSVTATVVGSNSSDISTISGNTTSSIANSNLVSLPNLKLKGVAANYVIRFTGAVDNTTFSIDSSSKALTFGTPTQLAITQSAAGARAGSAFETQPWVEIRDNSANLVSNSTLSVSATVAGRTMVGTTNVAASNGVVRFSGLGIQGAAATGLVLRFTAEHPAGTTFETTQSIDLTAGLATKFSFIQQPTTVKTRSQFTNAVSVQLLDDFDNPVPTDSTTVITGQLYKDMTLASASVNRTMPTISAQASGGVATFTGLALPVLPSNDYFLRLALGSFSDISTQFEVLPGDAVTATITRQPSSVVGSGSMKTGDLLPIQPEITLYDEDGYVARGDTGNVTVAISSGTGGTITGTTSRSVVNGIADFSGMRLIGTPSQGGTPAQQYRLTFSFGNISSLPSDVLTVTNADAAKLSVTWASPTGVAGEIFTDKPVVTILDRFDNVVETGNDSSLMISTTAPLGGTLGSFGFMAQASGGKATFNSLNFGGTAGTNYSIRFAALGRSDITAATRTGVQVTYGLPYKAVLTTEPLSLSGGVLTKTGSPLAVQPVVQIQDYYGNVVLNSNLTVSVTLDRVGEALDAKDRLINGQLAATNGVATFTNLAVVARPGTSNVGPRPEYRLGFSADLQLSDTSEKLSFRHGDPTSIDIVRQPSSVISAGVLTKTGSALEGSNQPIVRLLDFDGNLATEVSNVAVSAVVVRGGGEALTEIGAGSIPKNTAVFTEGIANFANLSIVALPGVEQAVRFEASVGGSSLQSVESAGMSFTYSDAHQLAISTQPCTGQVINSVCEVGITGNNLTVQPVIEVQDRYGNRVVNYQGSVVVTTASSEATLRNSAMVSQPSVSVNVSNGLATFTDLRLVALPGVPVALDFASGALLPVSSNSLSVLAANATQLAVITQPVGGRTGATLAVAPVIELRDQFNNRALSDDTSRVSVTASAGTLSGTQSVTATAGRVSFADLGFTATPKLAYQLTFTGLDSNNGFLTQVVSSDFTVSNAFANSLVITQQPTATKTGELLGATVLELRDFDGNLAEDDSATVVRVAITGGDNSGRFVDSNDQTLVYSTTSTILRATASAGVVRFDGLRLVGTPNVNYQLIFTANPDDPNIDYDSLASSVLPMTHADPTSMTVTRGPTANLTGEALTIQPRLELKDRFGNLATLDSATDVTASIYSGAGGLLVSGTTARAVAGVVTFNGLTATGTPGELYKLSFSASPATGGTIVVQEGVGFRLKKNVAITLSYATTSFVADGLVSKTFTNDSPGVPVFSTTSPSTICLVNSSSGQVTIKGVGTCSIAVTVPDTEFYYGGSGNANLVITKADQPDLAITSADEVNYLSTLSLTHSGGAGTGAISYTATGNHCRVAGNTLFTMGAGTSCTVFVIQAGDANYKAAVSEGFEVEVKKIAQTSLRLANATAVSVGDLTLFTRGGSGDGLVTYAVTATGNPNPGCSIVDGNKLRATGNGSCGVTATKAASANYNLIISTQQTITFSKAEQSVFFTSPLVELPLPGALYTPIAEATSGLAVTYSITVGNGVACEFDSVDPSKVKFLASGSCEITATQAGNSQYVQASATRMIQVGFRNQTITFSPITDRRFGQPAFMLSATASSNLAVSYSLDQSVSPQACSVSSTGLVTLTRSGNCSIVASQGGNQVFMAATPVTQLFRVAPDTAGAPHVISVSAANQSITALFNPPSYNGGSSITAYRLEAVIEGTTDTFVNPGCAIGTAPVTCTIFGLDNNENYKVRVAAITEAGVGTFSRDSMTMRPTENSSAVRNLIATPSSSQLDVNWSTPLALDGAFQSYEVYVWPLGTNEPGTPTEVVQTSSQTSVSFALTEPVMQSFSLFSFFSSFSAPSMTEVTKADGYNIKVITITDRLNDEEPENTTIGAQQAFSTPGIPAAIELTNGSDKLMVGWSTPAFDGGHELLGYQVMLNGQIACQTIDVDNQSVCSDTVNRVFEVQDIRAGQTYTFQVAAVNTMGVGAMATISHSVPAPVASGGGGASAPPPAAAAPSPVKPPAPPKPSLPAPPVAPAAPPAPPAAAPAPPAAPSDPGAGSGDSGAGDSAAGPAIGAPADDDAPPVPFDPLSTPEGVKALTDSLGNAAAAVGAIAAAAAAAAAAAGAAGGGSGGSGSSGSGGQGNQGGSIATIDTGHERFTNRRRGRGDKWKIWKKKWLTFSDKFSILTVIKTAKFSPLFSKIAVDGAYLRAAFGSLGLLPTIAAALISFMTVSMNEGEVLTPQWQWFIVLAVIGIFDAFAGLVGTLLFVVGTVVMHGGALSMDDVRLLLGVIIVGYGPALLANAFRAFRKEPEEGEEYWWERLVDLVVLPFIGGWVTATMISILPALAGTTMAVANYVNEFAIAIAIAITLRVVFEEFVGRWFPARLDTLHPTDVDDPFVGQKWISVSFRLAVFVFVTAALMGNVWQSWVGSALFILPTILGFYAHRFRNFPWIWRIMPTGIPGLAFALIVASVTTAIVEGWFGATPDLALWSFALLPIPMLAIAILAMIGREGNEGEVRWIRRPGFKWIYRIGGVAMLLATMELAGVLEIFPF